MKRIKPSRITGIVAALLFSFALSAQEKTTVTIQVKKDGEVVKDTTYQFDDAADAKHALKIMEIMSGDSLVWISEGEGDGEPVKVIKYKVGPGEHPHGEHVVVMKSGDEETFDILIDEDEDEGIVKKKNVKVIVTDDEDGEWLIEEAGDVHVEEEMILEEHADGDEVKVIVVKKKVDKKKKDK